MMQRIENRRIDFHHHFFPSTIDKAKTSMNVGWKIPEGNLPWDPTVSIRCMDGLGVQTALLFLPANSYGEVGSGNRQAARAHNILAAKICEEYPGRFGFLAGLPFLDDIDGELPSIIHIIGSDSPRSCQGVVEEIAYALDVLKADGIALTSSYGLGADASK